MTIKYFNGLCKVNNKKSEKRGIELPNFKFPCRDGDGGLGGFQINNKVAHR